MGKRVVKIINCKRASIRRKPWIPLIDEEIVGLREGPNENNTKLKSGKTIMIDDSQVSYDWKDRKFYKTLNPDGWIYAGCIDLGDELDE